MYYFTDQRPGESDILTAVKNGKLTITTFDGEVIFSQDAPPGGWTHELVVQVQPEGQRWGAEAYLDHQWIGSTEA
ncbi:hypothetical protein [Candidatus Pantoea multigeneris]|uniref:Uncharacterized protein n=1 Tax=Candidatus Pantoea multigeneris TaxID=2608357 RepID=A0ABX0RHW8_9GAMM|nr:hypothetical protein [Pantoea multigeneris]NIF23906.1 hypothetical protein [Pantoea multigeneris]